MRESIKKQVENYWNELLQPMNELKLLGKGEELVDARRASARRIDGKIAGGLLILTNERIVFLMDTDPSEEDKKEYDIASIDLDRVEEVVIRKDDIEEHKGQIVIFYMGLMFIFGGLMLFGLTQWGEYINSVDKTVDIE